MITPIDYSDHILQQCPDSLSKITSVIRHPRSLARPLATWRPPRIALPALSGHSQIAMTISRYRVGAESRRNIQRAGVNKVPIYVISARISSPFGYRVPAALAEGWIRALIHDSEITAVHELVGEPAPTFCWVVDSQFHAIPSPASLFQKSARAA